MGNVTVAADAQIHTVAAEHDALEDDVAGMSGGGGEEKGDEEEGGEARHSAGSSGQDAGGIARLFHLGPIGALTRRPSVLGWAGASAAAQAQQDEGFGEAEASGEGADFRIPDDLGIPDAGAIGAWPSSRDGEAFGHVGLEDGDPAGVGGLENEAAERVVAVGVHGGIGISGRRGISVPDDRE